MANKRCPECSRGNHDSKGDHLFSMGDSENYCCNRAEYHESGQNYYEFASDQRESVDGSSEESTEELWEVATVAESNEEVQKLTQELFIRDIEPDTVKKYGVHIEVDPSGKEYKHFYPIYTAKGLLGYEVRICDPKSFYKSVTIPKGVALLGGQHIVPNKPEHLIICEGFLDAMSVTQTLKKAGVKNAWAVSVNNGANLSSIRDNVEFIKSAQNMYVYPDQDEPGQAIIQELALLLPKVKILKTSEKDACDMLKRGKAIELVDAFNKAERYKPSSIVSANDVKSEAMLPATWGYDYPFPSLTKGTYGYRPRRIIGIGGGPGSGKTCLVKALQTHLIYEHKEPIGIFAMEETPGEALRELAGYVMNKPLAEPDCKYDPEELERVLDSFDGMVTVYNTENYEVWGDVEEAMRYMYSEGTKYMFIDPVSSLVEHLSVSEGNQYLNEAFSQMKKMRQSMDLTIFHVNHLNNPTSGADHSNGGKALASQFTGSKAMWRASTDIWGASRNQLSEDPLERNMLWIESLKYRKPSKPMRFPLVYNESTGTLSEPKAGSVPF